MDRWRIFLCVALACLAHGILLWLVRWPPAPSPAPERTVQVELRASEPAPPQDSEPPPEEHPAPEPEPPVEQPEPQRVATTPPPEPEITQPPASQPDDQTEPESAPDAVSTTVMSTLQRYQVPGTTPSVTLQPEQETEPRLLARQYSQLASLDHEMPELPFEDADYAWIMYSPGVRGDVERAFDKVTKTWQMKTPYGTKIQCAWVMVIVACGWE